MSIMTCGRKFFSGVEQDAPRRLARYALGVALACLIGAAHAASFSPSPTCEDLATGGNPSCVDAAVESLFLGSYGIGNTFNSATGVTPLYTGSPGFVDAYLFSVSSSDADALAATITLGGAYVIDGLSVRLYSLGDNSPASHSSSAGLVLPDTSPNGFYVNGTTTVSTVNGATVTTAAIEPTMLAAGQYALEVWGTVAGANGGSYSGTLNLSPPVPLPASGGLLLSSLALLALAGSRRKAVRGRTARTAA